MFLRALSLPALLTLLLAGSSAASDTRLLRADGQGVSFEQATPAGLAALAPRTLWIAVPPGMTVEVTSAALAEETIDGVRGASGLLGVAATTAPEPGAEGLPERGLALDALVSAAAPRGQERARLLGITGLRGLRIAAIELRPGAYDPAGDRLNIATRLAVDCAFVPLAYAEPTAAAPPPSPVFAGIERAMLLNAASADAFRPPVRLARSRSAGAAAGPLTTAIEVRVAGKGIQEVSGEALTAAGVVLESLPPWMLRLYTRPGPPVLDEDSTGAAHARVEVALRVEDGGDGQLDPEDRILFYGLGPSGWSDDYGVSGDALAWIQNPYETANVYLLTIDDPSGAPPLRWTTRTVAPDRASATPVGSYRARMHFEEERSYQPDVEDPARTWNPWVGPRVASSTGPTDVILPTAGAVPGGSERFLARVWARRPQSPGTMSLDLTLNQAPVARLAWPGAWVQSVDTTGTWLVDGDNHLTLRFAPPSSPSAYHDGYLLDCDLVFDRRLLAALDTLEFTGPDAGGDLAYDLAPFATTDGLLLLDVSDPLRPIELTDWAAVDTTSGRAVRFHDDHPSARYFAAAPAARRQPAVSLVHARDLRTGGADYLVICSDALESEALGLAHHRRDIAPPFPGATTAVVRISDVLAAHSGGRMDPVAIRNFLFDAVNGGGWSPAPSFVCLFGDATYDYRDFFGAVTGGSTLGRTQVPTFQHNTFASQYASDQWLADFDVGPADDSPAGDVPDLVVGRLPAANAAEARILLDKVRFYDFASPGDSWPRSGDWRNRFLWLVDDDKQRTEPDVFGDTFTRRVEELDRAHVPSWLERAKVNLLEYPLVGGTAKPGAQQKTIDELRRGALVWFFVGRANGFKLADENAFLLTDVEGLDNGELLPFFVANTSDVGPFDSPLFSLLGEAMVKNPDGGSVATFSATQVTFEYAGHQLATALLDALFATDRLEARRTIGEAAFVAANRASGSQNDRLFQLLGDPGQRLATAPYTVQLACFDDETGEALADSLPRGRRVRVELEVHATRDSAASRLASDFEGNAELRVTDSPPQMPVPAGSFTPAWTYPGNARDAALAAARVTGGRGTARFVVPLAATPGPDARVQAYVESRPAFASGARRLALGAARPDTTDHTGPRIDIRLGGIHGPVHGPSEAFVVFLIDSSGVRTLVDSTSNHVTLSLDGAPPVDVTSRVFPIGGRSDAAGFHWSYTNLADGMHTVRVEASDNLAVADGDAAHRTSAVVSFRVAAVVASFEPRSLTFPNPFSSATGTTVVFTGLHGGSHDEANILIHDVRGRRVRTLHGRGGYSSIQVPWDGRDDDGHALPPGVYLWRGVLSLYGGVTQEHRGRLVLLD